MLTIQDVANLAGVSKATVSRVLNNSGYVNEETRKKVECIVKKHHYVPMASAVNLSKQESSAIGVIVPEIDNAFYGDILHGITEVADEHSLSLIFFDTQNTAEKEVRAMQLISQQRVKGLILAPAVDYSTSELGIELRKQLETLNIPVVIVDRDSDNVEWDGVFYENFQSSYRAAIELYKAGNRRLGIITGNLDLKIGRDRLAGFQKGVTDCGLTLAPEHIYRGDFLEDHAYQLSLQLLQDKNRPDAIYCCNNRTSMGFLKAAVELGCRPGIDIGLIGNDRIPLLEQVGMPFSCVYRDSPEMGRVALRMLLDRIENPSSERKVSMMPYKVYLCGSEKKKFD